MIRLAPVLVVLTLVLTACATTQPVHKSYPVTGAFKADPPRSILVVPVLNQSINVNAPNRFLTTISRPIAERGYYVFPVNLVKNVLQRNGLANAYRVHHANTVALARLFGADAVLYITIDNWTAKYSVFETNVVVEFNYVLKSGDTGAVLWKAHRKMTRTSESNTNDDEFASQNNNNNNLLTGLLDDLFEETVGSMIDAAFTKASPNFMPLVKKANYTAFHDNKVGLPVGPYRLQKQAQEKSE